MPAAAGLETRRALATAIDLGREVAAGDRFYVPHLHFEILSNGKAVDPLSYPESSRGKCVAPISSAFAIRWNARLPNAIARQLFPLIPAN